MLQAEHLQRGVKNVGCVVSWGVVGKAEVKRADEVLAGVGAGRMGVGEKLGNAVGYGIEWGRVACMKRMDMLDSMQPWDIPCGV